MERNFERGTLYLPKEEREGRILRRLRPQGPGGFLILVFVVSLLVTWCISLCACCLGAYIEF